MTFVYQVNVPQRLVNFNQNLITAILKSFPVVTSVQNYCPVLHLSVQNTTPQATLESITKFVNNYVYTPITTWSWFYDIFQTQSSAYYQFAFPGTDWTGTLFNFKVYGYSGSASASGSTFDPSVPSTVELYNQDLQVQIGMYTVTQEGACKYAVQLPSLPCNLSIHPTNVSIGLVFFTVETTV